MEVKMQTSDAKTDFGKSFVLPSPAKGPSGKKQPAIIIACVVALLAAAFGGYKWWADANDKSKAASDVSRAVLTVDLTPVKRLNFDRKLLVSGTVTAWDPVQVGSEVSGLRVESINVDEGTVVKKGQIMATLNASILKAQLAQQEARLSASQAGLTKAIQPNRPEDLTSLQSSYDQAEVNVAQEESNLMRLQATAQEAAANAKRFEFLARQGVVSGMEGLARATTAKTTAADEHSAEAKVKAAKFAARQAHDRLTMGLSGGRSEDVQISKASLDEIKATVAQLRSEVAQTIIHAPCDGLVIKRSAHIGEIASASKVMFELVRDGRLELRAQVPEADLSRIKPGQKVDVQSALPGAQATAGVVREISPSIDLDSRLGTVKIDLPGSAKAYYRSGNFARGEIYLGSDPVMAVPSSCVVYSHNRAIVFNVSSDNTVQMRFVETGDRDIENVEIRSGLKGDEQLVARGAGFLKDGDKVRVTSRP